MIRPSRCLRSGNTSNATQKRQSTLPAETLWFLRLRSSRKPRICRPCCLPPKDDVGATTEVAPTTGDVEGRRCARALPHYDFGRSCNPCRLGEAIDYRTPTFILS